MMCASSVVGLMALPWLRRVAGVVLAALTVTFFILNLRRQGERAGRAAERLEQLERNDAIHRQMLDAAARRPRSRDDLLTGCAGVTSDAPHGACPPEVAYSPAEQARVAEEVAALSGGL